MPIHGRGVIHDLFHATFAANLAPGVVAAPQVAVHHDGLDALYAVVANQPRYHDTGDLFHGRGQLRVGAIVLDRRAHDPAQSVFGVKVGPRLLPLVVLRRLATAGGHGEAKHGLVKARWDRRGRGVQFGELGGQRLAGAAAAAGGAQVEKVGRHEVFVAGLHWAVGVGAGTEVGDGVVDCV